MRKILPIFFLLTYSFLQAQNQVASGRITSRTEPEGLPGVNVVVKGTAQGSITDIEGRFNIEAPKGATLVISFVGYQSQEVLYSGQANLDIILEEESKQLQ